MADVVPIRPDMAEISRKTIDIFDALLFGRHPILMRLSNKELHDEAAFCYSMQEQWKALALAARDISVDAVVKETARTSRENFFLASRVVDYWAKRVMAANKEIQARVI